MAYSIDIEALQLHRLLRKNSIDAVVLAGKTFISLALLVLLGFFVFSLVSTFIKTNSALNKLESDIAALPKGVPPPVTAKSSHDYTIIGANKIFGELGVQAPPQPPPAAKSANRLSLELIGTFVQAGQAPYAIIEDQKKKAQEVFMINETIFGEAKLISIYSDRVEIEQNGEREILKLDSTPDVSSAEMKDGVAVVGDNQYLVEEAEIDKALENLPLLLTQARAVPYFKEGKAIGLRMFAIRSGSIFEKIGLKNGDILKSINGNSMGDLTQAMKLFEKLKQERSLSLTLERNNADSEYRYQIK